MFTQTHRVAAAFLALLLCGVAIAAEKSTALQIDVLVFTQPGVDGGSYWQASRPLPVCHAVMLRDGSGAESAFSGNEGCTRKPGYDAAFGGFSAITSSALPAHAARLEAAGYEILVGREWRQASNALAPVMLRGGKTVGDREQLAGTLTLTNTSAGTEASLELVLTRLDGEQPQYVTLQETRVVKPGDIHYFDHPLFGVLLQTSSVP